ncbi:hypothetical protein KR067_010332, partial [Drosophila pandora]
RFNNRRLIFQAHVNEILGLNLLEGDSVAALRGLSDKFNAHMRALKNLGTTVQIAGCIVVQVLLQRLDPATQAKWEEGQNASNSDLIPAWESMAEFLEQQAIRSLEISEENYDVAVQLLENRFNNRRLIFQAHVNEILGLNLLEGDSVAALRGLSDKFNAHMRALKNLGTTVQIAGCIIVQVLLQRLDPATQAKWEEGQNASNSDLIPAWESMAEFLEQRSRILRAMDVALAAYPPGTQVARHNSRASIIITNSPASACILCGGWSHVVSACPSFLSLPHESRLGEARRLGLCRKCLQTGHHLRECPADNCRSCGRRHHSLLHF